MPCRACACAPGLVIFLWLKPGPCSSVTFRDLCSPEILPHGTKPAAKACTKQCKAKERCVRKSPITRHLCWQSKENAPTPPLRTLLQCIVSFFVLWPSLCVLCADSICFDLLQKPSSAVNDGNTHLMWQLLLTAHTSIASRPGRTQPCTRRSRTHTAAGRISFKDPGDYTIFQP